MSSTIAIVAAALSLGAIGWTFFIQAPVLTRRLGRDRFVPLQMALVWPLLALAALASVTMFVLVADHRQRLLAGVAMALSGLGAAVIPSALRAGGASLKEALTTTDATSAGRFLVDGGGSVARWPHRLLGLAFVGIVVAQGAWLVGPSSHEAPEHEHQTRSTPRATPETARAIVALRSTVEQGLAESPTTGAPLAATLQRQYAELFASCTMTGEAHELLHAFLVPVGELLTRLETTSDVTTTREVLTALDVRLGTFEATFSLE